MNNLEKSGFSIGQGALSEEFMQKVFLLALVLSGCTLGFSASLSAQTLPPKVAAEFRGAWVATVGNIDWPSKPGLPVEQQKQECVAILNRAAELRLNCILFQVRPGCDALYASTLEPWSEYLTGQMGKSPEPFYDPLEFAIREAHKRGIELHAWFNPFRVRHNSAHSPPSATHISRSQPELVRRYGSLLWLDPGEKAARDYSLNVIFDVVRRYEIDGIHLDDYFYPYPEKLGGKLLDFPDQRTWKKYHDGGGSLERDDWRRENVNVFVRDLYAGVKARKPWVKVGISPFGIWRPGYPAQIKGLDSYAYLYGDSRKWLASGWLDYVSPQLYWPVNQKEQSFPVLLKWWEEQNVKGRHLWPGMNISSGDAREMSSQIKAVRTQRGAGGEVFWSIKNLMSTKNHLAETLAHDAYAGPALVPSTPWLSTAVPATPVFTSFRNRGTISLEWRDAGGGKMKQWILQKKVAGVWVTELLAGEQSGVTVPGDFSGVAVTAVDRFGNTSVPAMLEIVPSK